MPEEGPAPLMGERLGAIFQRIEGAFVVSAGSAAGFALIYLAGRWAAYFWAARSWVPLVAVAACALALLGTLLWAVVSRSRVALPLAVVLLAFVLLPWLQQFWPSLRP